MDRKSSEWWEKEIAEAKLKEPPRQNRGLVEPKVITEELLVKCEGCGIIETITLTDGFIDSRLKYIQDGLNFTTVHMCRKGAYGEVKLLNGLTVPQYIKERKAEIKGDNEKETIGD